MYSNIPINELIATLKKLGEINNTEDKTKQDIMKISQVLVEQNYFRFQGIIYVQNEGFAIGAPTSSIFSEIYLYYIQNTKVFEVLLRYKAEGYFRYIDNILIMHKDDRTNIQNMLQDFNSLIPKIKFTSEKEENNKINFLDITIAKNYDSLSFEIYRKTTTTNVIIPNDSYQPKEHKTAAIRYFCNRMRTHKLTPEAQQGMGGGNTHTHTHTHYRKS